MSSSPDLNTLHADARLAKKAVPKGAATMSAAQLALLVGKPVFYAPESSVCCITSVTMDARREQIGLSIGHRTVSRDTLALDGYLLKFDKRGNYEGLEALVSAPDVPV